MTILGRVLLLFWNKVSINIDQADKSLLFHLSIVWPQRINAINIHSIVECKYWGKLRLGSEDRLVGEVEQVNVYDCIVCCWEYERLPDYGREGVDTDNALTHQQHSQSVGAMTGLHHTTIRFDQNILPRYLLPCYRVSSLMHKGGLPQIGYLMFQTLWGLNIFLKKLRNIPLKTAGTWHFVPDILSEMASNISLQKHAQCMES